MKTMKLAALTSVMREASLIGSTLLATRTALSGGSSSVTRAPSAWAPAMSRITELTGTTSSSAPAPRLPVRKLSEAHNRMRP